MYLVDGVPGGVMTVEIMNWTGKVTVAPRAQLADLATRDEVKRTGIYVLAGDDPENSVFSEVIYIGESDNVWNRLYQHTQDESKDFWRRTVVITSKDENLTKAHVRYLESRLIQLATKAQRAKLVNSTNPDNPHLPEPDVADMEFFLEQVQMLLPVLGLSFAMPLPTVEPGLNKHKDLENIQPYVPIFYMDYKGAKAKAQEISDEFIILKESMACKEEMSSLSSTYRQLRAQLVDDRILTASEDEKYWLFTQDVPLSSPSAAACIVGGLSMNGRITWHVEGANQSYAAWQDEQLRKAEAGNPETNG